MRSAFDPPGTAAPPARTRAGWTAAGRAGLVAVPVAFWALLFAYPMVSIVERALAPGGYLDLGPAVRVLAEPTTRAVFWFSFWQAAVSTSITLVLGLPAAYTFARRDFRGRKVLEGLLTAAFVMPTVVVALAFRSVLAPLGLGSGLVAILAAHCFFNYVVVVRTVGVVWADLDPSAAEAARTLGATRAQAFRRITLPSLAPAIASAAAIVFLFTFTSFGVVLVLGGPAYSTVEVEIWRRWTQDLDPGAAVALALCQMLAVAAVVAVSLWFGRHRARSVALRPRDPLPRRRGGLAVATTVAACVLLVGLPLGALVVRAFSAGGRPALSNWTRLGSNPRQSVLAVAPLEALANSVVIAVAATIVAVCVGGCAAVVVARRRTGRAAAAGRALDVALLLPLAASAVTIALGFLVAFGRPPFDLRTSPALIPLAHALVAVPFVVRLVAPELGSIDPRLHDAAATLGAAPARVWRVVDLPIVWRALLVAAGFAFCISLGEFGATLFLARPDLPTVPVAIARLLSKPGSANLGQAASLGVVLVAITAAVVLLLERWRPRELGDF